MQSLKVMIVDDQRCIRRLLTEFFKHVGWQPLVASSGIEALDNLWEEPDVVLLDMKMPGMDGVECLAQLRHIAPHIPVIVMTAYGELGVVQEAEALGVEGHLLKPFDLYVLSGMIEEVCARQTVPA